MKTTFRGSPKSEEVDFFQLFRGNLPSTAATSPERKEGSTDASPSSEPGAVSGPPVMWMK